MLRRDQYVVYSLGLKNAIIKLLVLDNDLRFAVRTEPGYLAALSLGCHQLAELIRENMRVRMQRLGVPFVGGVAKHEALIAGSHVHLVLLFMYSGCNVCILCLNIDNDYTFISIESDFIACEANVFANVSNHLLEVDLALVDADLAEQDYHASLGGCLHRNFCIWVNLQASIKNAIGDLVAEFVWMACAN